MTLKSEFTRTPIYIHVPENTASIGFVAILLATIGRPPSSQRDIGWQQTVSAYRRESVENDARAAIALGIETDRPLEISPRELLMSEQLRADRLTHARRGGNRALFSAAVANPDVTARLYKRIGIPKSEIPRGLRSPGTGAKRIEALLQQEDELAEERRNAGISSPPSRISYSGPATGVNLPNVRSRILQPVEPVLHLALALKWTLDATEIRIAQAFPEPESWEKAGFGTAPETGPDGRSSLRPFIMERNLFNLSSLFNDVSETAEMLLPDVEAYLRAGRRKSLRPMVRLIRN